MTNCTALVPFFPYNTISKHLSPSSWIEVLSPSQDYGNYPQNPSLTSFRDRERFKQVLPYHIGVSQGSSSDGRQADLSMRGSLRLQGTYTREGELVVPVLEKGIFLDCLG